MTVVVIESITESDFLEESEEILEEQAAVVSSCAWALEHPHVGGPNGKDVLGSVAILLHSVERELRRVKDSLHKAA